MASFSDAELLTIFLRTGVRGKSALDLAQEFPAEYGGLRSLTRRLAEVWVMDHSMVGEGEKMFFAERGLT